MFPHLRTAARRSFHQSARTDGRLRHSAQRLAQLQQPQARDAAAGDSDELLRESLPPRVSLGFFRAFLARIDDLDAAAPHAAGLRALAAALATQADASLFRDAAARWRRHPLRLDTDAADQAAIADRLAAVGANDVLLQLALNPFKYGMYLSHERIHRLMRAFADDFIVSNEEAALDNIYKAFALLLKSNESPAPIDYLPMVLAGAYGSGDEAWTHALTSVKEAEWLFGGEKKLPASIIDSLVAGYIRRSEFKSASELITRVSQTNGPSFVHPRLRVEAFLMNGELERSVNALSDLILASSSSSAENLSPVYSEKWTSVDEVQETLLAELKEKDDALHAKATNLLA
ncbi:hypothetical protein BDR26DRAFT_1002872 [Obelidium mucronatum]|nr:hypothetical protein BDR26DRAFT_1002872 [Obelidium mucronatum]